MNIFVSYFYQIRFFDGKVIPLSTALWDPKWYHENKGQSHVYRDKNGTYVGLRYESLMPGPTCHDLCSGRENCEHDPALCRFLKEYRKQLNQIDFSKMLTDFSQYSNIVKSTEGLEESPDIALIVHEAPSNPCSERHVLKQWFEDNGYCLKEWPGKD